MPGTRCRSPARSFGCWPSARAPIAGLRADHGRQPETELRQPWHRWTTIGKRATIKRRVAAVRKHIRFASRSLPATARRFRGVASFLHRGTQTASGERFADGTTAAHPTLPFGTAARPMSRAASP